MALSTSVKVGIGGSLASVGGVAGAAYLGQDYLNYYEVERKVMNEEVDFIFDPANASSITIKTKENNDKGRGTESSGYYWECVVSGDASINLSKTDFEAMLSSPFLGDVKKIRKNLVSLCSGDRVKKSDKQVKSKLEIPSENQQKWFNYLFGSSDLKQVEREVIGKDLKLTSALATNTITIKAPVSTESGSDPKLEANRTWTCEITKVDSSSAEVDTNLNTKLSSHFPTTSSLTPQQKKTKHY